MHSSSLKGQVDGVYFTDGNPQSIAVPVADLLVAPNGKRERQLLLGARVTVFEYHADHAFVQAADGYAGYVPVGAIGPLQSPDFQVATLATHAYETESFKSPERVALPFGARVKVVDERPKMFETDQGFVPKKHLRPLDKPFADPATVAQMHFNAPYLWGGNSTRGIDCSGLISASLAACDIACPGDSDLQCDQTGRAFAGALQRGDLMFWKGTYNTGDRWPDVSHVMVYMGRDPRTGKYWMFGGRGRSKRGVNGGGVDFHSFSPRDSEGRNSSFIGYGSVPGMRG